MSVLEESDTYQAILTQGMERGLAQGRTKGRAEGRAEEARRLLLVGGEKRFGPPTSQTVAAIEAITDLDRLEELLLDRLTAVSNWGELLAAQS